MIAKIINPGKMLFIALTFFVSSLLNPCLSHAYNIFWSSEKIDGIINSLVLFDFNGDNVNDIVAIVQDKFWNCYLHVYDGKDLNNRLYTQPTDGLTSILGLADISKLNIWGAEMQLIFSYRTLGDSSGGHKILVYNPARYNMNQGLLEMTDVLVEKTITTTPYSPWPPLIYGVYNLYNSGNMDFNGDGIMDLVTVEGGNHISGSATDSKILVIVK